MIASPILGCLPRDTLQSVIIPPRWDCCRVWSHQTRPGAIAHHFPCHARKECSQLKKKTPNDRERCPRTARLPSTTKRVHPNTPKKKRKQKKSTREKAQRGICIRGFGRHWRAEKRIRDRHRQKRLVHTVLVGTLRRHGRGGDAGRSSNIIHEANQGLGMESERLAHQAGDAVHHVRMSWRRQWGSGELTPKLPLRPTTSPRVEPRWS